MCWITCPRSHGPPVDVFMFVFVLAMYHNRSQSACCRRLMYACNYADLGPSLLPWILLPGPVSLQTDMARDRLGRGNFQRKNRWSCGLCWGPILNPQMFGVVRGMKLRSITRLGPFQQREKSFAFWEQPSTAVRC
jgi:hypothetical protein